MPDLAAELAFPVGRVTPCAIGAQSCGHTIGRCPSGRPALASTIKARTRGIARLHADIGSIEALLEGGSRHLYGS